jgi:multidrug efflux system membrane fusion protein
MIVLLAFAIGIGLLVWRAKSAQASANPAARRGDTTVPITPGKVKEREVSIYFDGLGTVQAYNTVTVKSRVDGQLVRVAFREGQDVHSNDVLAEIDPAPFKAALDQAKAKGLSDQANLDNARLDLQRDLDLTNIVTRQALDTQSNLVRQLESTVANDAAGIESSQVQLDYATVRAPLDGRCGVRLVDQGNIVHAADSNGLVVITQLRPIFVVFTLPEQEVGAVAKKMGEGPVTVLAMDANNKTVLDTGTLAVIDNQIDSTTGTIRLKASFPNSNLSLWPGEFINPRVLIEQTNGLTVPESVIQRGPDGDYVFTIVHQDTNTIAKLTPVTVAKMQDDWALISQGLTNGQDVVVDGQYRLEDGTRVKVDDSGQAGGGGPGRGNRRGAGGGTNRPPGNQSSNGRGE